ncbi:MAG: tyrosine-type recombinase/integrase, partial [Bacteroidales bacterium]|nr:tyrosine-type recombinase/integrase [Bacteroidales bacterium]
ALAYKVDADVLDVVSDEMFLALKEFELTKTVSDIVPYAAVNELILKRYKACLIIAGRSPKTIACYERIVIKLYEAVQKNYTDMTVSDLRYFLAYEKSRGVSNRTLDNTRVQISSFFTWLLDEELIFKNPCRTIAPIKYTRKVKAPFSSLEIDAMRIACRNPKERAIIEFLLSSGVRVSELCSIQLSDIDFDNLTVVVKEGKGAKQRIVYINELAKKHLIEYLSERKINGDYVFYSKFGNPMSPGGIRHLLKTIEHCASITNVHPHRFRRTLATNLASRGMDIQEIARLLGHSDLNTTQQYVYINDQRVQLSYKRYIA